MVVTLKDIAEQVGKSVTTVSRALNDYDDVSPETKALVRRVAAELGYFPNTLAQRFQKQHTDTIGLIIPTYGPRFSDPFFSEFLAGVGNRAAQLGYDLLVSTRAPGEDELATYRTAVQGRRVDGFIIVRTRRQDSRIECLQKLDFPFVAFGRSGEGAVFPYVDEDGAYGMMLVAEHLVSLGHQRIAYISPPPVYMFTHYRLQGFKAGLATAHTLFDDELLRTGDLTQRSGYEQANELLDLRQPPTAIVASNDLMAFGAMSAAQERGLLVGQDISITGFDNIPLAEHSHPPLTTVHQPVYQIGEKVCGMLISLVRGAVVEKMQYLMKPELVIRQSTAPVQVH